MRLMPAGVHSSHFAYMLSFQADISMMLSASSTACPCVQNPSLSTVQLSGNAGLLCTSLACLPRLPQPGATANQAALGSGQIAGRRLIPDPAVDLSIDSSQDSQGASDQALLLPEVQRTVVRLPDQHQRLFEQMKQEQVVLLRNIEGVDPQVRTLALMHICSMSPPAQEPAS